MSRASTSTVMEMVRSREDLKEIESMTEWSGGDIFVLAAREGYAFDDQGICSQVGVAHAAGALLKYQGKGVRKQRTPRGPEPIQEAQCSDDEAHVPHEWILGSRANGVVRACRGWTQEQVDEAHAAIDGPDQQEAAEDEAGRYEGFEPKIPANAEEGVELGEAMTAAEYGVALTDVDTVELDESAQVEDLGYGGEPCGDLDDDDLKRLANPAGCYICRDPKDHDGKPHSEVVGDGMTRDLWRHQWINEGKTFGPNGEIMPEGWFPFGTHADRPEVHRLVFSDECDQAGDPLWEKPFEGFGGAERPRSYIPNDEVDSTEPPKRQDIGHGLCPRCGSNDPKLHPATAFEGEVIVCPHDFHAPAELVAAAREGASGIVGPFEFEIEQLVAWAARWEPEIGDKAQSVRILAEGVLAGVRDLHEAVATWERTVKRTRLQDEADRLAAALAAVQAQLDELPGGNDRSQVTPQQHEPVELHFAGPGERPGDPGVVPRPVLLGQARPMERYHNGRSVAVTEKLLSRLHNAGISQKDVRAWCVEHGSAGKRGGLSLNAILGYMSAHGISREESA